MLGSYLEDKSPGSTFIQKESNILVWTRAVIVSFGSERVVLFNTKNLVSLMP